MNVHISGRGYSLPYWEVTPTADGIRLRVDDRACPESWIEVFVDSGSLHEWLRQVNLLAAGFLRDQIGGNLEKSNKGQCSNPR